MKLVSPHRSSAALARNYQAALRLYVEAAPTAHPKSAHQLGALAANAGINVLELSEMHAVTLTALLRTYRSTPPPHTILQANAFFSEAIRPIEQAQAEARAANAKMALLIKELTQRTVELATTNDRLSCEVGRRKAVEKSLRTSEQTLSALLTRARTMQGQLRQLSRRLLSAHEEERKKISRELHDVIAQTLTGINYRLAALHGSAPKDAAFRRKIIGTQRLVAKAVDSVSSFARDLRPAVLDHLGLIPALHGYLKGFMGQTGIRVGLIAFDGIEKLGSSRKTMLYRIVQETLTNVARHAQASEVELVIRDESGGIEMEIADNGTGFDLEKQPSPARGKRLGLLGMKERAEMVGGTFNLKSIVGEGTAVTIRLPRSGVRHKVPPPVHPCP